jgi:catechol 2,3-dioxygenase-like lactoylglutathione lyase family enzyme
MAEYFKRASGYQGDALNLPVADLDSALPYYQDLLGFEVVERRAAPYRAALLARDEACIGLAENGGDPSQDGAFLEVDDVEAAYADLKARGLPGDGPNFRIDRHGDTRYRVFFVIAPDGLCYCIGQRVDDQPV